MTNNPSQICKKNNTMSTKKDWLLFSGVFSSPCSPLCLSEIQAKAQRVQESIYA